VSARLTAFAGVFGVSDVETALAFYRDRLGFAVQFRMGEPASYAIVERGAVSLHLMPEGQDPAALGRGRLYVFVDDVDALHAGLVAAGCPIEVEPTSFGYGMRECSVRDPDGNRITFGMPVSNDNGTAR
jgi:catechol 2,3-dioxygenase-like lactoylglutathione lyase family enzyme